MTERVLIAEDREGVRLFIAQTLAASGFDVKTAYDGANAAETLKKHTFELLITDLKMPKMDGMELLEQAKESYPDMEVIVLTAHGTIESAVTAIKLGAFDYLTKPLDSPSALRRIARRAIEHSQLKRSSANKNQHMVIEDPAMQKVMSMLSKVASTDATVLLTGESGTGKEIAAREIHSQSKRSYGSKRTCLYPNNDSLCTWMENKIR